MITSTSLSPILTNLYAELLQQVQTAEAQRSIGDLQGTFVSKKIKGKNYWYLQHRLAGSQNQIYLGPENKELLSLIDHHHKGKSIKLKDQKDRQQICALLAKGGMEPPEATISKILKLLAESGIFKMGAILVGTHAFNAYAPVLGITWHSNPKTQDIDLAQEAGISIALAQANTQTDLPETLTRAKMGFFPIPPLNNKHPSTSFKIRGQETHLDILTPLKGKESEKPIALPSLNVAAQPLRFLDFLIEDVFEAVIPYDGGILINLPDPARYALHKMIVAGLRGVVHQNKMKKDLMQASALLKFLIAEKPGHIELAWKDLKKRGKNWTEKVKRTFNHFFNKDEELTPIKSIFQ